MKHISYVDNLGNLHALVRQELRDLGVKVPKAKKSKRSAQVQKNQDSNRGIFGNYLAQVPHTHVPSCGYVATFLVDAAEIIRENVESEGVFRKSGAVSRQKEIKQQLDNGKGFCGANVHDVTALVKQFFRELPEPLFTSMYHDTFIQCYQIENSDLSTRAILLLCLLLPAEHLSTLRFIMKLLAHVTDHVASNKMDSTNLAVVLAPNIMHVNSKSETMKSSEERMLQVQMSVVDLLIQHADEVGMVDDLLIEKTAFMSEVFSTDDELDASDDLLEDSKETRKEKKRKRSGSFQGFVSSIAQSITKWRRSTDGKTNTSGISQGSTCSNKNTSGHWRQADTGTQQNQVYQFTGSDVTPVVRRKKTAPCTEGRAFSASKKKAILNQLPQHSALASTPFTPATGLKRMDIHSGRRGVHDTPSMPPRPYQTPRHGMKTPRKKLGLFSPASTTKKKRYSSTTNLPLNSSGKKGKSKSIFRRLSGSKGDQAFPSQKSSSQEQIGQRLANSPASTTSSVSIPNDSLQSSQDHKHITDESPIAAIAQNSFSSSVCEQSVISQYDEDSRSLNEGFIVSDEKEGDITRIMSEPAIAGAFEAGEYVCLNDIRPRGSVSDTTMMSSRSQETPKAHCRSFSVDSTLDGSTKRSSLSRGRPNTVKNGLLQGNQSEVQKLRRSFGLDRSDIGSPVPLSISDMSDEDQYVQLDGSFDFLKSDSAGDVDKNVDQTEDETSTGSPSSVSRCCSSVSGSSLQSNDTRHGSYDDDESDCGFSAISGGTVIKKPKSSSDDNFDESDTGDRTKPAAKKCLAQQKQESKDSLLSEASSTVSPLLVVEQRMMTRSLSRDSGKGSMCDEQRDGDVTLDSISSSVMDSKESSVVTNCEEETAFTDKIKEVSLCQLDAKKGEVETRLTTSREELKNILDDPGKLSLVHQKSISSQDLQKVDTPTRVSRSKSMLENTMSQRRCNIKPNLQISAETHKLLARAGYIKEENMETLKPEVDDFVVPATFPFIEQPESWNPRRESVIALQKNNAGKVKSSIQQFDRITDTELNNKHASPLRFPNSTTRKRAMTRLRIPPVFKNSETENDSSIDSDHLNMSKDRISKGIAMVPISTQLIKPSDSELQEKERIRESSGLKRKPSIYRADKGDAVQPACKERRLNRHLSATTEVDETLNETNMSGANNTSDKEEDSELTESKIPRLFHGMPIELDQSLQDTINSVCTPDSEKVMQNLDMTDKENSFSVDMESGKMPDLKLSALTPPVTLDNMTFRTASKKTPVDLFKSSRSPRSPIKPLKRLGSSPHSPRNKPLRSPNLVKANRRSLLSALPSQNDDFNNL